MKIIRSYILDEVLTHLVGCLWIMTFVLVLGNVFSKMFDLVINRGVDLFKIAQIFLYSMPFLLIYTLPMSALVATLLVFGRLSADRELIALRASGVNLWRVIRPVLIAAFLLSLFALVLNDRVASKSHYKVREISANIGIQTPAALLEEGVFIKSFKDFVLFIHRIDGSTLHQIRIYQPQKKGPTRTIVAERAELLPLVEQNLIKLKLINGMSDEPDPNNPEQFYKLKFGTYFLPMDVSNLKIKSSLERKRKEQTIHELWAGYQKLRSEGFKDHYLLMEVHYKIALALSVFVLTWMAIPLAIQTRRGERSVGFAIALVLGTFYWAFLIGAASLAKTGTLPPEFIVHLPNAVFLLFGGWQLKKILST